MTPKELIAALRAATPAELKVIRELISGVERPSVAEITGDPDAGQGFGQSKGRK